MKGLFYRGFTAFCMIVFIISLFSIGSGWFPIVTMFASEAWIIHVLRKGEVMEDVDEN